MRSAKIYYPNGFFTAVMLPEETGTFPIIIQRSPYVDAHETMSDEELCKTFLENYADFLDHGFGVC